MIKLSVIECLQLKLIRWRLSAIRLKFQQQNFKENWIFIPDGLKTAPDMIVGDKISGQRTNGESMRGMKWLNYRKLENLQLTTWRMDLLKIKRIYENIRSIWKCAIPIFGDNLKWISFNFFPNFIKLTRMVRKHKHWKRQLTWYLGRLK